MTEGNSPSDKPARPNQNNQERQRVRVRKKKKKKKSGTGMSPEMSSRLTTLVLILLGVLFVLSLYYVVVNINVKSVK